MEGKLDSMSVLDNSPQKPVVRMANLCVVAAHTVHAVYLLLFYVMFYSLLFHYHVLQTFVSLPCSVTCYLTA
jgi:starch phosphorylase